MNRLLLIALPLLLAAPSFGISEPTSSTSAAGAPVQQRKRDFSRELSTVIEDVDRAAGRIDGEVRAGSKDFSNEQLAKVRSALDAAKARWNALNAAAPEKFDHAREEAQKSLSELNDAYFHLVGKAAGERSEEQKKVAGVLDDLAKMRDDLHQRASAAGADARGQMSEAADRVEKARVDVASDVEKLKTATGERWTELRKQIEKRFADAREAYWGAVQKAS